MFALRSFSKRSLFACLPVLIASASTAPASINLEWRPVGQTVLVDDVVHLGLYAVSDSGNNQLLSAIDLLFSWDPNKLELQGLDPTGGAGLLFSGFPVNDAFNLNEVVPPQDGDGYYNALANFGSSVAATPSGTLLTTFLFRALAETPSTQVLIEETAGSPESRTVVFDGTIPNTDVTGTLGSATVTIVLCLCPGDMNGDDVLNGSDIQTFIDCQLGLLPPPADCNCADLNGINGLDFDDISLFVEALITKMSCP